MLTQSKLKEIIEYDPLTGIIIYKKTLSNRIKVGEEVNGISDRGYKRCQIEGKRYQCHDLAWLYMTGEFPKNQIDHIDCNPENLKFINLRESTQMQNCCNRSIGKNNSSGIKGVKWHKSSGKWYVSIDSNYKRIYIGSYDYIKDAEIAVKKARLEIHKEFANHSIK